MPTLVERCREVVSAEADDFFNDDTILYYLNRTQEKIVSFMVQQEQQEQIEKSFRSLDSLRKHIDIGVNGLTFNNNGDYYIAEVQFPSSPDEINQFMFVKYGERTVMRELTQNNRIKLEWGNLSPTQFESYYMISQDSNDNVVFEIFTKDDDSSTNKDLRVYYVLNPTDIILSDESMDELPNRLENALIYGAAKFMIGQESVNDQVAQQAVKLLQQNYNEEIQINAY